MALTANTRTARGGSPQRPRNVAPVIATLVCVGLFSFLSGGFILTRSAPIAIAYLLLAAVWVWFLRRRVWPPPLLLAALVAMALFTGWVGLSTLWSLGPDLSWAAFDLAAFYLAVLAVVGLTPIRRLQLRLAGWGFLAVATAVAVYAFLGKGLPDVVRTANTSARVDSPIGYWNVLALVMVMGLVVLLALAGDRALPPVLRALVAACGAPMALTFFFTFSRGGWIVLAVALLVYFAASPTRLASVATLAAVAAPAALVLWRLRNEHTLFAATTDAAQRTAEGHALLRWALAALLVTAGAQVAVALAQAAVPWPRWTRPVAGALVVVVIVAGGAGASWRFLAPRGGVSWLQSHVKLALIDSGTTDSANEAGRLTSFNTGRPPLWREALRQSRVDRLLGTGAGTFVFTHYRFRQDVGVVRHAHNQWLNVLSELGVVGLVLFVVAMAALAAACLGNPFANRRDGMRPLLVALQAGVAAFIVHISWDWDWDMAAAGAIAFLFIALAASYQATRAADERTWAAAAAQQGDAAYRWEPVDEAQTQVPAGDTEGEQVRLEADPEAAEAPARGSEAAAGAQSPEPAPPEPAPLPATSRPGAWPLRVAGCAALLLLAVSWALPYASATAQDAAVAAAGKAQAARSITDARRAERFDPLAVAPLLTESQALQQLGREGAALAVLRRAEALQPDDFESYYREGLLQLTVFGRRQAALDAFRRALQLNPLDPASRQEVSALLTR
jgi:tetratricopeptide (TPR) repeat protein